MAVNKVVINDNTVLDLTGDTVTPSDLREGVTAHDATGMQITGTRPATSGTDTSDATATAGDIARGKTAYVQGQKITGELKEYIAGETLSYYTSVYDNVTFERANNVDSVCIKIKCFGGDKIMRSESYIELSADATIFGNATAADVAKGKTFTSASGLHVTGTAEPAESNNNVEAYAVTTTNPSVSFKRTDGTIKIWGYGTITSQGSWGGQTTSLIAFAGDKYYKSAMYGGPSSTGLSLSISNGKLSGLPSGLTEINAIVTRGI